MAQLSVPDRERPHITRVVSWLQSARSLLFITGAGLSADSGLPTYRGIGGLYNDDDTEEGLAIEEALSGPVLAQRPEITWRHILRIEKACRGAGCNRGHEVIAALEKRFERVWVLTQNIDGFHHAAGSRNVIDIHGDVHHLRCTRCRFRQTVADYSSLTTVPPRCPECGAVVRPEVVLFGEMLPPEKVDQLQAELRRGFDVVFSVGTTSVFPYIARPVIAAKQAGVPTVEINPGTSQVSDLVDIKIAAGAAAALDAIWRTFCTMDSSDQSSRSEA
jgi:NAD-dependent deacetylase